jgi:hypothetical protein
MYSKIVKALEEKNNFFMSKIGHRVVHSQQLIKEKKIETNSEEITAYTDGSLLPNGIATYGVAFQNLPKLNDSGNC